MCGSLSKTIFFFFSSKFSKILSALSDSNLFKILTIDSIVKIIKISVWIDSLSSVKISGSKVKPSSSISFERFSGVKFSIISAESAGCSSLRVLLRNSVSLSLIFLLKT